MENSILEIKNYSLNTINDVTRKIIDFANDYKIWIFDGEMGAGKTTLISYLAKNLNIIDDISSPTFAIVNEYIDQKEQAYYHFDFYRIKNEMEAIDIGVEEYFYSGNVCFLEWASLIPSLIPGKRMIITITIEDESHRTINVRKYE